MALRVCVVIHRVKNAMQVQLCVGMKILIGFVKCRGRERERCEQTSIALRTKLYNNEMVQYGKITPTYTHFPSKLSVIMCTIIIIVIHLNPSDGIASQTYAHNPYR